jgi:hypothetical protein
MLKKEDFDGKCIETLTLWSNIDCIKYQDYEGNSMMKLKFFEKLDLPTGRICIQFYT